jgi:hypothetical protein
LKARIAFTLATVALAACAVAGLASATPTKTDAQVLGNVRIDPSDSTVGYVTARYICNGGPGAHLWVSVKQVADRSPDNALRGEGSSQISAAWSQSHPENVACDGRWHTQTFTVSHAEYGFGYLAKGQGYVEFCLYPNDGSYAGSMRFASVG